MNLAESLELLKLAASLGASDLHLTPGVAPTIRLRGRLSPLRLPVLAPADTESFLRSLMADEEWRLFNSAGEIDLAYSPAGLGRYRINGYRQRGFCAAAVRIIPHQVPGLQELGLPEVVAQLARQRQGLVLVTGPSGSGKTTTLAAMIDLINRERRFLIITLEAPVEYLHRHRLSIVNQREVPADTVTFASGLRAALRQNPDLIMVGEMRDLETTATCLTAAETGHLVFSSLHSLDATGTVNRMIDIFPPHQQPQVKMQLATVLRGVISQQLFPEAGGRGMVPAVEVMVVTPAIRNLIREGKTYQLYSLIQTGSRYGMQTMESSLEGLCRQGRISREDLDPLAPEQEAALGRPAASGHQGRVPAPSAANRKTDPPRRPTVTATRLPGYPG